MNPTQAYIELLQAIKDFGLQSQQYRIAYHEWLHAVFWSLRKPK